VHIISILVTKFGRKNIISADPLLYFMLFFTSLLSIVSSYHRRKSQQNLKD